MRVASGFLETAPVDALFIPTEQPEFNVVRPTTKVWPDRLIAILLVATVLLAPLPAASNHPLAWLGWAVVIGLAGALHSAFARRRTVRPDSQIQIMLGLGGAVIVFALWQGGVFSAGTSIASTASLLAALRMATYLAFFVLMLRIAKNRRIAARISQGLFFGIALHALLAMVFLNLLGDSGILVGKTAYQGAATGSFVNKNSFATFLGMGLIIGLAKVRKTRKHRRISAVDRMQSAAIWLCLGIILIALVNTQSRMGMAATIPAAVVVLASGAVNLKSVFLIIGGGGIVIAAYGQPLLERFAQISGSGVTRLELYQQVFSMIKIRPLTGFGFDSFPVAFEMFHRTPVTAGFVWDKAHSTYLTLWVEAGLLFGSFLPFAGVLALVALWRTWRARTGEHLALAGIGALVLCGLHSTVDFSLEIQANMFVLLAIVALGLGGNRKREGP